MSRTAASVISSVCGGVTDRGCATIALLCCSGLAFSAAGAPILTGGQWQLSPGPKVPPWEEVSLLCCRSATRQHGGKYDQEEPSWQRLRPHTCFPFRSRS